MKREFLQNFTVADQPLPKEVIDAIMAENGRDIQKVKGNYADYEDVKNQLEQLRQRADQAEEYRLASETWQEKYRQALAEHKQQLAQMAFEKALGEGILKAKGRNAKAITALLDLDALKDSENQQDAIERALEVLKQDSRYLFEGDVPPPYARGTGAFHSPQEKRPTTLAGALREKFERK